MVLRQCIRGVNKIERTTLPNAGIQTPLERVWLEPLNGEEFT